MQTFSLLTDPRVLSSRSALLLLNCIGGNVATFRLADGLVPGRPFLLPETRTDVELRDQVKSILRGVFDFNQVKDQTKWYPDPAVATPGASIDTGSGPSPATFGVYNLDPYAWFVHTQLKMSGYGFSLDDDRANTQDATNSLEIGFGGLAYTAPPVDPGKYPPPTLQNLEGYDPGAHFGTETSQGFIDTTSPDAIANAKANPQQVTIGGLDLAVVLKLKASTSPSDPQGALITGPGVPPGATVYNIAFQNPTFDGTRWVNHSWVSFLGKPPTQDGSPGAYTFSGFSTRLPDNVSMDVTSGKPGDTVNVSGTGFTGVLSVAFNGTPGIINAGSTTRIDNSAGGPVTITTNKTNAPNLVNGDTVTISEVTGQTTINGTWVISNVMNPTATTTSFQLKGITGNGVASGSGYWQQGTDSAIRVIVPGNATTGLIALRNPSGTGFSGTDFQVNPSGGPTFSGIDKSNGSLNTDVTLTGTGFTGTYSVKFNGGGGAVINNFTPSSDGKQLTVRIPVGATGTGTFTVTTPGGTATSTGFTFTVNPPQVSSSFSPKEGPVGTTVRVEGSGFTGADQVGGQVTFGVTPAVNVKVLDDNHLTADVAPGTTGEVVIFVTTSAGTGDSGSSTFNVTNYPTPDLQSASPGSGPVGALVQLKGSGFAGATQVTFNGTAATPQVVDDSDINVSVPAGATSGPIVVSNPKFSSTNPVDFKVTPATRPMITSFSPLAGAVGQAVEIAGSGFTGATTVLFNNVEATFSLSNDALITTTVPLNATTGPITVSGPLGAGVSPTNFTVTASGLPTITGFSPASGGPVGTLVTINGTGFVGTQSVSFNGTAATGFTVKDDTEILVRVPAGATTGPITVLTSAGLATSKDPFTILSADEGFVNALYVAFLGRSGSRAELDGWVADLPNVGRAGVVDGIMRSDEALSRVVNALYVRLLNRSPVGDEEDVWVDALANRRATEEQVIADIVASQEFKRHAEALFPGVQSNAAFVKALYTLLFNRTAGDDEVNGWVTVLGSQTRDFVAGVFVGSAEFRGGAVRTFFGDPTLKPLPYQPFFVNLLRRSAPPAAGEVNPWVTASEDLLSIEAAFASSNEFYQKATR